MSEDGATGVGSVDEVAGPKADTSAPPMAIPGKANDYTDGRSLYDWKSKFPTEARRYIYREAAILAVVLLISVCFSGLALLISGGTFAVAVPAAGPNASVNFDPRALVLFFGGSVGGTTFSIKWLIHSVAKGSWHLDRQLWRLFVPLVGGVYACAVLTLLDSGTILGHTGEAARGTASAASMAFLIGYFSDGVSGLLTNIANAVFGTVREK